MAPLAASSDNMHLYFDRGSCNTETVTSRFVAELWSAVTGLKENMWDKTLSKHTAPK
jgi:hypothetical protein